MKHLTAKTLIGGAVLAFAACAAQAHEYKAGAITIGHPYARTTVAGQPNGGAYLTLTNGGTQPDRLVGVASGVAKSVELHTMSMDGNVMRMRQVEGVALKPGETVAFKPGNYHVMLVGLKAPLQAGTSFPLDLTFEKAGTVTVEVKVEGAGAGAGADAGSGAGSDAGAHMPGMKH